MSKNFNPLKTFKTVKDFKRYLLNWLLLYLSDCDGMCNHCDIKKECDERKQK